MVPRVKEPPANGEPGGGNDAAILLKLNWAEKFDMEPGPIGLLAAVPLLILGPLIELCCEDNGPGRPRFEGFIKLFG